MSNELEAFIEYITVTKALSQKSVAAYKSDLLFFEEKLKRPLIELDTAKLLSALEVYDNKRTLNRKLSSINAFFEFCYKAHFAEAKTKLRLAKIPKHLPVFLSYEAIQKGLEMIDRSSWIGLRDYALILFLYASGARISECLEISRNDIDGEWLHIRHAKGEKERIVPLAKVAQEAIDTYLYES